MLKSFLGALLLFAAFHAVQAADRDQYEIAIEHWAQVLETYVDEQGRTDFAALAENADDLRHFVGFIEGTSPASHPALFPTENDVLAFHINAYNALAMYGVIGEGIPVDFDSFFKRLRFFKFRSVVIGGEETSLQDYENGVIRPLGEDRAHFALNCMVRDCPRLPQQPFQAETLEQQLENAAHEFFSKPVHLRVDDKKRTVYVSEILKFYTADFVESGKKRDLVPYINRFREPKIPVDYRVKFIDYDWTINQQPR